MTITIQQPIGQITMEIVDDPREIEEARTSFAHFDRNLKWYAAHSQEVFARGAGRHICIAGEELFVADTVQEVLALAKAAHPEDKGMFSKFVRAEKHPKIYAYRRRVASLSGSNAALEQEHGPRNWRS